jgi:hypothetical protein
VTENDDWIKRLAEERKRRTTAADAVEDERLQAASLFRSAATDFWNAVVAELVREVAAYNEAIGVIVVLKHNPPSTSQTGVQFAAADPKTTLTLALDIDARLLTAATRLAGADRPKRQYPLLEKSGSLFADGLPKDARGAARQLLEPWLAIVSRGEGAG